MYSTCNLCIAELLIDVMIKTRKLITANKTQNISAVALLFYITNQATVVVCVIRNEYIARNCNTFTVIH